MQLPTIEWTDGNLGILPQQQMATAAALQQQQQQQHNHHHHHHQVPNLLQEKLRQLSQQSQLQLQSYLQPLQQQPMPPPPSPQEDDEDSVFCINTSEYLEFPVPPSIPASHVMHRRQESLNSNSSSTSTPPTRLNSLIIVEEEEDSDDESMPSTPFNDSICYDESNNINNKTEQLALINTPSPLSSTTLL